MTKTVISNLIKIDSFNKPTLLLLVGFLTDTIFGRLKAITDKWTKKLK
jgi:hypothetical protein